MQNQVGFYITSYCIRTFLIFSCLHFFDLSHACPSSLHSRHAFATEEYLRACRPGHLQQQALDSSVAVNSSVAAKRVQQLPGLEELIHLIPGKVDLLPQHWIICPMLCQ